MALTDPAPALISVLDTLIPLVLFTPFSFGDKGEESSDFFPAEKAVGDTTTFSGDLRLDKDLSGDFLPEVAVITLSGDFTNVFSGDLRKGGA